MPNVNCCIPYCCADSKRHRGIRFYTLPKDRERRQAWILLIRNINLRTTSRYTSVCSLHFPGGSKTYDTKDPSIFPWSPQWPAVVNEYNNRQKMYENDPDSSSPYYKKSRPMTLRIPPMCPWASQFNEFISSKSVHDFYSPKTLQVDMELQDVTSNSATSDFLKSIEAECQKIKSEPLEPVIYPTDENKYEPSMGDKMSISSPTNNKNLNLSEFCTASPLSSELLLQSPINNNDLHSTLFSSSTLDNQITEELVQVETEIRRRTLLMNDHYNRKLRQEFHRDSSYASNKASQMNVQQAPPTEDLAQTVQIQSKKNLPTGERNVPKPTYSYVIHKHQGNMLSNMAELWKKGKFCDATIGNGTMKIMVHKIVLVALSPELLNLPNQDLDSGCIQVNFPKEIKADALWAFAKFMYEGVVSLNLDVLEDMERISRILQLQDLQDMCQLYRSQVNLPSDTLSSSIVVKNDSSTNLPSNLNSLQPSIQSDTTSNNVSILNLPSGNITQTISRPVQHLQTFPPGPSGLGMSYSNQQSPLMDLKLSPGHTLSNSESDIIILNNEVKQEPLSPVNIPQQQDKDLLIALSCRQSDNQLYLHDDYSEPWQPSSSHEDSELTGPSPKKQLKPNDDLQISDPHTLIKNELDDLEKKSNDVPCEITLVPVEDVT